MREVFAAFLRLGCTSFGGPIAHLAYFRRTFVEERRWLDEPTFARIVGFCSVLPGPTSSQVGMLIGLTRGGPAGALAAWLGFTAPSAVLMTAVAAALTGAERHAAPAWFSGLLDGLFAAAAAVVTQAVIALAASLCTDLPSKSVAVGAMAVALALRPYPGFQWLPIVLGALAGALALHAPGLRADGLPIRVSRTVSIAASFVFVALVAVTALPRNATTALLGTLIRAGALVFGGGHVVLPLLQSLIRDRLIAAQEFFAGYGAAQAMPGPLNTFATFVGYANTSPLHGGTGRPRGDGADLPAVVRADLRGRAGMEPHHRAAARGRRAARRERERRRAARRGAVRSGADLARAESRPTRNCAGRVRGDRLRARRTVAGRRRRGRPRRACCALERAATVWSPRRCPRCSTSPVTGEASRQNELPGVFDCTRPA